MLTNIIVKLLQSQRLLMEKQSQVIAKAQKVVCHKLHFQ